MCIIFTDIQDWLEISYLERGGIRAGIKTQGLSDV
jgi:hypothetical protein